jgi:hypothetical protein
MPDSLAVIADKYALLWLAESRTVMRQQANGTQIWLGSFRTGYWLARVRQNVWKAPRKSVEDLARVVIPVIRNAEYRMDVTPILR